MALVLTRSPAQTVTGTIVGMVTDPSKSAITDASVNFESEGTGARREVFTTERGEYSSPLLPPGTYRITFAKLGFKTTVLRNLKLDIEQTLRADVQLHVRGIETAIDVTADGSPLQTDTSSMGAIVRGSELAGLPLNQRSFLNFALLVPGVTTPAYGSFNTTQGGAININGARESSNNFLLDGVDNNDPRLNQYSVMPPLDGIAEFKVQSGNYSAEFGRTAGGQINVLLKTGTNSFHGSAFELLRNRHLDAKNFFDPPDCTAESAFGMCGDIPRLDRSQFGGSIGGPIIRNRTFFFGAYDALILRQASTRQATVPSLVQRQAALLAVPGPARNASGEAIFNLYPIANAGRDLISSNTYVAQPVTRDSVHRGIIKVDQQIGSRNTLSTHYALFDQTRFNPYDPSAFISNLPGFGTFTPKRGDNVKLAWTHVAGSRAVNEARFGFSRTPTSITPENAGKNLNQGLAFPEIATDPERWGFPNVDVAGFDSFGEARRTPQRIDANTYHFADNFAWMPMFQGGRHQFKFGGDARFRSQALVGPLFARGSWAFQGTATGDSLRDLLQGSPAFALAGRGNASVNLSRTSWSAYFHDDFRWNSRLTLNIGLRYEFNEPPVNSPNSFSVPDLSANSANCTPRPQCQYVRSGTASIPVATFRSDRSNFAPRIGLAWRPPGTGRLVVRGAYGIFYDELAFTISNLYSLNPPDALVLFYPNDGTKNIQTIVDQTASPSPAATFRVGPDVRDPYVQQWNFGLQCRLWNNLTVDGAYVGTKGTKLIGSRDLNQPAPGGGNPRPYPQFGPILYSDSRASSSYNAFQLRVERRMAAGASVLAAYTRSKSIDDASSASGLADSESLVPQNSLDLRTERGLSTFHADQRFVLSYRQELSVGAAASNTWIRAITTGWRIGLIGSFESGHPFSVFRSIDQSGTGTGPGGDLRDRPDVVADAFQAGPVAANPDPACAKTVSQGGRAADIVRDPASWFNACAFAAPSARRFGNSGRNNVIGPGIANIDLSLIKLLPIHREFQQLELRLEFFNLLNHPIFDFPENFFDSARFTQVKSANAFDTHPPRQIQVGLRFTF